MTLTSFKTWLSQPSTITGLGTAFATISGLVAHVITHDTTAAVAAGGAAFALVHVIMPDNSGAQSSIEKLVTDTVTAAAEKRLASALPLLIGDVMSVAGALTPAAATTTTTTTTVAAPAVASAMGLPNGGPPFQPTNSPAV